MSSCIQHRVSLDCNAKFVAYSLLSGFGSITEKERDATQFILGVLPSCVNDRRLVKVPMTNDAYTLAQVCLPELRVMASRHSYVHDGALRNFKQAAAILNVIVSPLISHLSREERKYLLCSISDAEALLSNPLGTLNELVGAWKIRHFELFTNWRSLPIPGVEQYSYGAKLPVPLTLEEILTPLPYPPGASRVTRARTLGHTKAARSLSIRQSQLRKSMDLQPTARFVHSRPTKGPELKTLDSMPRHFVLPDLIYAQSSSDASSISTDDCGFRSLSSRSSSPLITHDAFEESAWDIIEDGSDLELECTYRHEHVCGAYLGCRSMGGTARRHHSSHRIRIIDRWRSLLKAR
ncbi:hypothetical protein RSOLAG1IB_03162 [Rhizoctonia solani AG-1 IB]|uniref:Uncharacterized protein n=1 Tax=Thanatephorus cucumeris (strain AG1-IB / isolate 7/3/14) TaxID=1108050 RepID=A0A0B7FQP2_THACB|nr:hypothetical protein RSOLAG1IB_03162 [Rhizoctonia solani AG-1 IB]